LQLLYNNKEKPSLWASGVVRGRADSGLNRDISFYGLKLKDVGDFYDDPLTISCFVRLLAAAAAAACHTSQHRNLGCVCNES
jgi:hypothetical protein